MFFIAFIVMSFINYYKEWALNIAIGIFGAILGFAFWISIGLIIGLFLPTKEIVTEQKIYALNDNSSIECKKFIFSGYVNEKFVCSYVIDTDKGKHIEQVDGDCAYIIEGNYTPKIEKHSITFKEDWYYLIAMNAEDYYVKFFVPEGTVTSEYNIDLK